MRFTTSFRPISGLAQSHVVPPVAHAQASQTVLWPTAAASRARWALLVGQLARLDGRGEVHVWLSELLGGFCEHIRRVPICVTAKRLPRGSVPHQFHLDKRLDFQVLHPDREGMPAAMERLSTALGDVPPVELLVAPKSPSMRMHARAV